MAATLEELVVKLRADTKEFTAAIQAAAKTAEKATEQMGSVFDRAAKRLSGFNNTFQIFIGNLASQVAVKAFDALAGAAGRLFSVLVVDGIKAAEESEDALNKLNTALRISGQYSKSASRDLQQFAAELQATTKYEDDAIISAQGLIQSLGQLDRNGLKKATQAAVDLSAALGIDLNSAAQLVGKAASGEVGSFSRFGLTIDKGATQAETFSKALEAINSKFGGAAAAQVKTFSGAVAQLNNTWGDLQEQFGNAIVQNQAVINVLGVMTNIIREVEGGLKDNEAAMKGLVAQGVVLLIDGFSAATVAAETTYITLLKLYRGALNVNLGLNVLGDSLRKVFGQTDLRAEETANRIIKLDEEIQNIEKGTSAIGAIQDSLYRLKTAAEQGYEAIKAGNGEATERDLQNVAMVQTVKADAIRQEIEALIERNDILRALDESRYASEIEKNQNSVNEKLKLLQQEATETLKIKLKLKDQSDKIDEQRKQAAMQALNDLAIFQNAKSKELAAVGKAAAISATIISTYEGAQKAYSSLAGIPFVGPVLGTAAAAAAIAGGLARVAMIQGTPLKTGLESVPGIGTADSFPAMLQPRERVITRKQNEDLTPLLSWLKDARNSQSTGNAGGVLEIRFTGDAAELIEARLIERGRLGTRLSA